MSIKVNISADTSSFDEKLKKTQEEIKKTKEVVEKSTDIHKEKKGKKMKKIILLAVISAAAMLTGCQTAQTIAGGIAKKNISANALYTDAHIGIDPETKIPELKTTFISGDYSSVQAGTNAITFREESAASIWNAESVTKKRFLTVAMPAGADMTAILQKLAEIMQEKNK